MKTGEPNIPEIGIDIDQFFRLRTEGYVYVDKTQFVHEILTGPRPQLFLSRPRRFCKTLLVDTLEEALAGRSSFPDLRLTSCARTAFGPARTC
jgi:hypothetical protein